MLRHTHYTVTVGAVILDDADRVLLLDHPFRRDRWGIPGGFVARREQPEESVRREVREEVGLAITDVELSHTRALIGDPQLEIIFRARAKGEASPDDFEVRAARWVPLAEIGDYLHPDLEELVWTALGRGRPEARVSRVAEPGATPHA